MHFIAVDLMLLFSYCYWLGRWAQSLFPSFFSPLNSLNFQCNVNFQHKFSIYFFQRYLESAQNRSKKLGISSMTKVPLSESNFMCTPTRQSSTKSKTSSASPRRRTSSDRKPSFTSPSASKSRAVALRTVNSSVGETKNASNIDAKENVDLALEINITTGPNVQVIFPYYNEIYYFSRILIIIS